MSQILPHEKRSWWSVAFIWIGTMICIPMLMVGGMFGGALTLGTTFVVTVIGFAICCFLMVMGGIIGSDLGLNATMTSTRAFGMTGANVSMALVVFIAEAGWFAVQTATCALAANTLMELFGVTVPFWLSCVIWGYGNVHNRRLRRQVDGLAQRHSRASARSYSAPTARYTR